LNGAKRETDVVGWFSHRSVLGVIVPEIASRDSSTLRVIEARLRTDLAGYLNPSALATISLDWHAHLPFKIADDIKRIDPLLPAPQPRAFSVAIKRALDVTGSLVLLVVLSPLFLLVAGLVKFSSKGPVVFRQVRIGQMEKPFLMLKFRTMRVDAAHAMHHEFVTKFIKARPELSHDGGEALFKIQDDPRVTSIGPLLRKTSLDELPQLWNVLRGEMSLVGPRPAIPYEVEQYEPWHCRRVLEVKPGITGLWQVTGRSRRTFDEMVRLDLRYARTCSLWTDIKILLATPGAVISGKGAA
jgi:lipopolysaccharide/colanic/teichoic acid biosynthesis glycosyltransferase